MTDFTIYNKQNCKYDITKSTITLEHKHISSQEDPQIHPPFDWGIWNNHTTGIYYNTSYLEIWAPS